MDIKHLQGLTAYKNNAKMMQGLAPGEDDAASSAGAAGGPSFSKLVGDALNSAIDTGYKSEAVRMDALAGKAELSDLVSAVSDADLTLNTVIAIRDRVISAYQDILRMAI